MFRLISIAALVASAALGQQIKVDFPADAPLSVAAADWGESRVSPRGGALVLDLRAALTLKNTSNSRVRGVTLLVTAADLTAGGKAFVTVPSLDVKPGESFPVRVDMRLLRPSAGLNAPVAVTLDGVLFDTLAFYGPNKLNSRRAMLAWELEARRDRKFFLDTLSRGGPDALRQEIVASLSRQDSSPRLNVEVTRGRVTAVEAGQPVELAVLNLPGSPVEILRGAGTQFQRELALSKFELENRSKNRVRHVDLGWLSRDTAGGTLPADVVLAPGERKSVEQAVTLRFPAAAMPISTYVSAVEYEDGNVWIPGRNAAGRVSPEEQRLSEIYRRKGLDNLIVELKKFQ